MSAPCTLDSPNAQAFLKLIRYAEHYPDEGDDFYNTLYGGGRFNDLSRHPKQRIAKWGHVSGAAGAYQFLGSTWDEAVNMGVVADFTPEAQDKLAWWKVQQRGAREAVCEGDVAAASLRLRQEWTSLPGAHQSRMSLSTGVSAFQRFGGAPR